MGENKRVYKGVVPYMAENLLLSIIGAIDIAFAGILGDDIIVVTTIANSIMMIFYQSFAVLNDALRIRAAKYYGASDCKSFKDCTCTGLFMSVSIGAIFAIILWITAPFLLQLVSCPETSLNDGLSYIYIRIPGFLAYSFGDCFTRSLMAEGKSGIAVKIRYVNLLDCAGNAIVVLCGFGIWGIGLATAITEFIELLLLIFIGKPKIGKPKFRYVREIFHIAVGLYPIRIINRITHAWNVALRAAYLSIEEQAFITKVIIITDIEWDLIYSMGTFAECYYSEAIGKKDKRVERARQQAFNHCRFRISVILMGMMMFAGLIYYLFVFDSSVFLLAMLYSFIYGVIGLLYLMENSEKALLTAHEDVKIYGIVIPLLYATVFPLALWAGLALNMGVWCMIFRSIICHTITWIVSYRLGRKYHLTGK